MVMLMLMLMLKKAFPFPRDRYMSKKQSSIYVAEAMEGRLVVIESCAHIPMDEQSEVRARSALKPTRSDAMLVL